MNGLWRKIADGLARFDHIGMITVLDVKGSAPREAGTRMLLFPDGGHTGTIGGGELEHRAMRHGFSGLKKCRVNRDILKFALGPDLAQCCGGSVRVMLEIFGPCDKECAEEFARLEIEDSFVTQLPLARDGKRRVVKRRAGQPLQIEGETLIETFNNDLASVAIFGAGHVGWALVLALAPLPFSVLWFDSRIDAFPRLTPLNATKRLLDDVGATVSLLPPGAMSLVMTHSHPLDLQLCDSLLSRADLPFVGLIGSKTKRARFQSQLIALGHSEELERLRCPIGQVGITNKDPAVIAASVAAQLLQELERGRPTLALCQRELAAT